MRIIAPQKIKIRFYLSFALIFIFSSLALLSRISYFDNAIDVSADTDKYKTIIIDAGHGSPDGGTSANDGTLEKDLNLQIAYKLNNILQSMGYETLMTRSDDNSIHDDSANTIRQKKISDLKNRLEIINNTDNAVFVSIHQNHYQDSRYSGTQVFYSKNNPHSKDLAESIRYPIISYLQTDNSREIKKSGSEIYLLNNSQIPSVMVECGFMSNPDETDNLKDNTYQQKIAFFIAIGIADFISETEDIQNGT
ncbi:MAG: N-acetylmuramoyl-L-alanine amidase [Acutalibacteraceae bacterium]|nr:N-acetylmuramoyl-L-alanine amidase [Acutalibacteraceae bacterium]